MSHPAQSQFIAEQVSYLGLWPKDTLEIGSLDINGSVREHFVGTYWGLDLGPGRGVDLVADGAELPFADSAFEVAVSTECFEHNPRWRQTFAEMCRVASFAVLVTCASTGRPEHGTSRSTPEDSPLSIGRGIEYYANVEMEEFAAAFDLDGLFGQWGLTFNKGNCDLYFWGLKWAGE